MDSYTLNIIKYSILPVVRYSYVFCLMLIWSIVIGNCQSAIAQINPDAVTIVRDKWGVPHIFAKTDAEVAYGLAWAHAEDDFKTIQLTLLPVKGLLGKHLGKEGAAIDYVVGLIRAREMAAEHYPKDFSADYQAVLEGYVAGMNAYAQSHPEEVLVKKAFPIRPQDTIAGFILANASFSGIDRALKAILDGSIPDAPDFSKGSNAFAFSSRKTTDGKTYLAINSHQPLEGPVAWYEAHLCSEQGWNILGGLFPGSATVLHGCNENLGWAHTVNYHDKMDLFQLEMNPASKLQYKFDGEWKTLETKKIKLRVKSIPFPISKKAYWSVHGPTIMNKKGTYAMRYSGMFECRTPEQWYRMNKAHNFSEFYQALQMTAIAGGFNIIYADRNDTIFYLTNGKIPLRNPSYDWKGTLPGNTSKTLWTSFHPLKDLPQIVSPQSGYVFNTNNTPYNATAPQENLKPANFDPTMGIETFELNRSVRVGELMEQYNGRISYEDFKRIKYDVQLPQKLSYLADLSMLFSLKPTDYPGLSDLITKLQNWNRRADVQNTDATAFVVLYYYLKEKVSGYRVISKEEILDGLRYTQSFLMQHFNKLDVPLGDFQKHVRGKVELPIWGIPDVLAAIDSKPYQDGKRKAHQGESYIELVKFSKEGLPEIETVNAYGASNHSDNPHYTDQMELFVQQKTKKMTLNKAVVLKEAMKTYHPK